MSRIAKIEMLASSLDRNTKIVTLKKSAMKVLADEGGEKSSLKVFRYGDGAEFAYNMYKEYVSEGNFQYFPSFLQKLDQMVFEFRDNQPLELVEEDDDEDEDEGYSSKSSKRRRNKYKKMKKRPRSVTPIPSDDGTANTDEEDNSVVVSSVIERIKKHARR